MKMSQIYRSGDCGDSYDDTLTTTPRSRTFLEISAAYVNVAMRSGLTVEEMRAAVTGQSTEITARAYAVSMNLAFAAEVALKGKLTEEIVKELKNKKKGHDLVELFEKLPKVEQEQIRMNTELITGLTEEQFDRMMDLCRRGFEDWRYFFENSNASKPYNYFAIISFLYAVVYSLISNEGREEALEDSFFKEQAYVGETGLFLRQHQFKTDLVNAKKLLQEEGVTEISESDKEWIGDIIRNLSETVEQIKKVRAEYKEKDGAHND